jgi:hypothetical protein
VGGRKCRGQRWRRTATARRRETSLRIAGMIASMAHRGNPRDYVPDIHPGAGRRGTSARAPRLPFSNGSNPKPSGCARATPPPCRPSTRAFPRSRLTAVARLIGTGRINARFAPLTRLGLMSDDERVKPSPPPRVPHRPHSNINVPRSIGSAVYADAFFLSSFAVGNPLHDANVPIFLQGSLSLSLSLEAPLSLLLFLLAMTARAFSSSSRGYSCQRNIISMSAHYTIVGETAQTFPLRVALSVKLSALSRLKRPNPFISSTGCPVQNKRSLLAFAGPAL